MVPNPIKMDDLGVPLFLETPIFKTHNIGSDFFREFFFFFSDEAWSFQFFLCHFDFVFF